MTLESAYMHKIIVMALNKDGANFVKPSELFAKLLDAVPKATAMIKKNMNRLNSLFYNSLNRRNIFKKFLSIRYQQQSSQIQDEPLHPNELDLF